MIKDEVTGGEHLHGCLCLVASLPARAGHRPTQLGAVVAQRGDDGPVVQATVHLRHIGQGEPARIASCLDVDIALIKNLGEVAHLPSSCI